MYKVSPTSGDVICALIPKIHILLILITFSLDPDQALQNVAA